MLIDKGEGEELFIPEKYVNMLELLVEVPKHGKGILVKASNLANHIKEGRIHPNVVTNREAVYVIEQSAHNGD